MNFEKMRKLAKERGACFIDLKFVDLPGAWHHVTLAV